MLLTCTRQHTQPWVPSKLLPLAAFSASLAVPTSRKYFTPAWSLPVDPVTPHNLTFYFDSSNGLLAAKDHALQASKGHGLIIDSTQLFLNRRHLLSYNRSTQSLHSQDYWKPPNLLLFKIGRQFSPFTRTWLSSLYILIFFPFLFKSLFVISCNHSSLRTCSWSDDKPSWLHISLACLSRRQVTQSLLEARLATEV